MIKLQPAKSFRFPVIAECITPDAFKDRTLEEIGQLGAFEGNRQKKLGELFKITEINDEIRSEGGAIVIDGDVSEVRRIGSNMNEGRITINGNSGMHLGEEMRGGKIIVRGNVDAWTGSMMSGGSIEIYGNAGDYVAAPYRGSAKGMHGGKITVHGNAGNEAGASMKKGIIKIYGSAGQFTGLRMHDGAIYVQKNSEARAGACMTGGKIVIGGCLQSVLPTFAIDSLKSKVKIDENETVEGPFYVFLGDLSEHGNGKLYVSKNKNPDLNYCEKFL